MSASEAFKAGRLHEAIEAQVRDVKAHPADHGRRLFLVELLAFAGDLDRARRQADAVRYEDPNLDAAMATYRALLDAEASRRRLFAEGLAPKFLADPPGHLRLRLEAVEHLRGGRPAAAAEALARADEAAPATRGTLNARAVEDIRDADDRFGPVLEVMAHGEYYWVPLEQVESLTMNPPRFPRDLLWVPARLEMEGAAGEVFLPALYPGSHGHEDDAVKLGRATTWSEPDAGPVLGAGSRAFLAGDGAVGLLEWREFRAGP